MGTWGPGGFENDAAADLVAGIVSVDDLSAALAALPDDATEELDADQAQEAIAVAECVAVLLGRAAPDAPADLVTRLGGLGTPDDALLEEAREAVSRVLGGCELTALWAEADAAPFNRAMTSLIERLNPHLPFDPPDRDSLPAARQVCGFCDQEIAEEELVSIEASQVRDPVNQINKGFWCHLGCLNERLHPGHLVQTWTFDPEVIDRMANELLKE